MIHVVTQPLSSPEKGQKHVVDKQLLAGLSVFQKILLVTDGTVTKMLEQYLDESIKAYKLYECIENRFRQLPKVHQKTLSANNLPVLHREILLQGQSTLKHWVYAESSLVLNNIDLEFRKELFSSGQPIGKLWMKYQVETYKRTLVVEREKAGELATHFDINPDDELLSRTYSVYSGGMITMLITEKFPTCFFLD